MTEEDKSLEELLDEYMVVGSYQEFVEQKQKYEQQEKPEAS